MQLPKISIVTPSYNQAAFIERSIQSVLNQNYPNLEYIIIDGGSIDGSAEGQTHAINKGFRRATGEIVAWLNSDDIYTPGALSEVGRTFALNKHVDLVFGNTFLVDKDDNVLRDNRNVPFWWPAMIVVGVTLPQPATFWKRWLFEKYGYLDESKLFCMDYEFFCRIGRHIKAKHIPRELACFRLHREQKTETINDVCVAEGKAIKKRYRGQSN
jgi:glycosyltransferase involved in cell wall biosynthesis